MPLEWRSFDSYKISYLSGHNNFAVEVNCNDDKTLVGRLRFVDEGQFQFANSLGPDGILYVYYPLKRFPDVLEILREEKPLLMYVDTDSGTGSLSTGPYEPVGEDEGP